MYLRHLKRNWMTMTCVTVHCRLWIVSQQSIHCPLTWSGLAARRWRRGRTCWIGCWGQRSALPGGWPAPPWESHTMGPQDPHPAAADCQQKFNHLINTLQSSLDNPTLNHMISTLQPSLYNPTLNHLISTLQSSLDNPTLNHMISTLQPSLYNPTLNHLINTLQSMINTQQSSLYNQMKPWIIWSTHCGLVLTTQHWITCLKHCNLVFTTQHWITWSTHCSLVFTTQHWITWSTHCNLV